VSPGGGRQSAKITKVPEGDNKTETHQKKHSTKETVTLKRRKMEKKSMTIEAARIGIS